MTLLGTATMVRADVIVYNQPSDFPVTGAPGLWASQNDNGSPGLGNFATAYDNFTLTQTTTISDVHWQGGYFDPPVQGTGPDAITAFTLTFYADAAGQPGTVLLSQTIPGNANETFVGTEPAIGNGGNLVYNYSTNLTTPFVANGGTPYWLSIVPNLTFETSTSGQWGWHSGTGGDGSSQQDFLGDRFTNPTDLAFALSSPTAQIPEPASLAVWGLLSAAGLAYRRYRGRAKQHQAAA